MRQLASTICLLCLWMVSDTALAGLIEIGSRKQLFVDDYLIESMTNTRPVLNPAEKAAGNPVLRADKPWEGNDVRVSSVIFDEAEQLFRMWYSGRTFKARGGDSGIVVEGEGDSVICLATSKDGVDWDKSPLGKVEFQGSKENNILPNEQFKPYFFLDLHEEDPSKRYKGLERRGTMSSTMQFDLYYSADGFQWTACEDNPVIDTSPRIGRWGPTDFMGWDPVRQVYAVHMENSLHRNSPMGKRLIGRAESPDMIHWSEPETIIVPDDRDPPDTEFYHMPAITYEGLYLGLLWNFRTTNTTILPQIVFSRDGIHYNRDYREPFIARGANGSFDASVVYPITPIVHGDSVLVYYSGANWRSPEDLLALGDRATCAVGLATSPRDGFVSFDGAKSTHSQVVTRSFTFSGSQLHLNLKAARQQWGAGPCDVRAEILEATHHVISGFSFKQCDPITRSGLDHVVSWNGRSDLSKLVGRPIKLRFYFKNAKLYAFQFK